MSATRSRHAASRPERLRTSGEGDNSLASESERPKGTFWGGFVDQFRPEPHIHRRLVWILIALMAAFSVAPFANNLGGWLNKDYDLWFQTGQKYGRGLEIYPTDGRPFPFMYPPAAAALMAMASGLGRHGFVWFLLAVQSVAWAGAILLSVKLATGKALGALPVLYMAPTLLMIPFVHDMYLLGQPNLLLLFLMLGSFVCFRAGRPISAGALIGLAASIKAFPVLALGYLVYRRQWKASISVVVASTLLLLVLPLPFRGPSRSWNDMAVWTRGMVLKYDEGQIAQRPERCYSYKNQSLIAVANRLLRDIPADGERKDPWRVNVASLEFKTVNAIAAASGLVLCLFYVAAMRWSGPRDDAEGGRTFAAETAMLLLMILVFSPFAFNYFYVWLIYPLTVALSRWLDAPSGSRERLILGSGLATAAVIYAATLVSLRGAQAHGNLLAVDVVLLGLLGWLLIHDRSAAPSILQSGARVGDAG